MKLYVYQLLLLDNENRFNGFTVEADDIVPVELGWMVKSSNEVYLREPQLCYNSELEVDMVEFASTVVVDDAKERLFAELRELDFRDAAEDDEEEEWDEDPLGCSRCLGDPTCPAFCNDCLY